MRTSNSSYSLQRDQFNSTSRQKSQGKVQISQLVNAENKENEYNSMKRKAKYSYSGKHQLRLQQQLDPEEEVVQETPESIDIYCLRVLQYLHPPLMAIHNQYFPPYFKQFNIKGNEEFRMKSQTKAQLFQFLKSFEICPQLLTIGAAQHLFQRVQSDSELLDIYVTPIKKETLFTFNQFCNYLARLAFNSLSDEDEEGIQVTKLQKLCYMLERMELSNGYMSLNNRNLRLRVSEEIIELIMINPMDFDQYLQPQQKKVTSNSQMTKRQHTLPSRTARQSVGTRQYDDYASALFEQYYEDLMSVFKSYAGINPQNGRENELVGSKWLKILKDAQLINSTLDDGEFQIPHSEVDIIFANACQQKKSKTMSFLQFLKGLQLLTTDPNHLKIIISEHIITISKHNDQGRQLLNTLMSILKDKEIVEMLSLLHKSITIYYRHYANNKQLIQFENFFKFYKDFQIFPDFLTKNKIIGIFQLLSKLYQKQNLHIDQHMFVESIALAALEIEYTQNDMSQIEKICYLIERINQSEGPKIVQKQLGHTMYLQFISRSTGQDWDLLFNIRKKFDWLFYYETDSNY